MRSPLSPPNHQSSSPASHSDWVERDTCPAASVAVASAMTSPDTPASRVHLNSPRSSVVPLQPLPSCFVSRLLS